MTPAQVGRMRAETGTSFGLIAAGFARIDTIA